MQIQRGHPKYYAPSWLVMPNNAILDWFLSRFFLSPFRKTGMLWQGRKKKFWKLNMPTQRERAKEIKVQSVLTKKKNINNT